MIWVIQSTYCCQTGLSMPSSCKMAFFSAGFT